MYSLDLARPYAMVRMTASGLLNAGLPRWKKKETSEPVETTKVFRHGYRYCALSRTINAIQPENIARLRWGREPGCNFGQYLCARSENAGGSDLSAQVIALNGGIRMQLYRDSGHTEVFNLIQQFGRHECGLHADVPVQVGLHLQQDCRELIDPITRFRPDVANKPACLHGELICSECYQEQRTHKSMPSVFMDKYCTLYSLPCNFEHTSLEALDLV